VARGTPGARGGGTGWIRAGLLWGLLAAFPAAGGGQVGDPVATEPSVGGTAPGPRVEAILGRPLLNRIHWGIVLLDPVDGRILYERNADLPFVPASNMKIPVTWAALELLGPSHRYVTPFHADAPPRDGVVQGDLVLRGSGDPSLGPPFHPSAEVALQGVARRLADAGVRRVEGALVVDVSAWDSTSVPTGWLVGNLSRGPAATGGAFAVGNGLMDMTVTGGSRPGEAARITWRPLGTSDFVESRVRTGNAGEAGRPGGGLSA
jgi:serine-type D-Ala-D-Ala carboxypeptidase/endopeptidase (penicillin-binding protein 4)